ncbi:MAG: hypothetical protein JRH20_08525 [Deltaproteobacteria bacterium]|nr:hypothetical protein [Deltaproteobacteria bacterium]
MGSEKEKPKRSTRNRKPSRRRRSKRVKDDDLDVVLLCNPMAGGRWKELAGILDSEEARSVRRIVTDSLEDVAPALATLSQKTALLCIYGGDGTIQRVLDRLYEDPHAEHPQLAFIGGGTMNVITRWSGLRDTPEGNFRSIVRAFRTGQLLMKEVPLLHVRQGDTVHHGFTFGVGPAIRVLNMYEKGRKGRLNGAILAVQAALATIGRFPTKVRALLEPMEAEVIMDGEKLPYGRFSAIFCNSTGRLHIAVEPFIGSRGRDNFYCAAYAVSLREMALMLPFLARGWLPLDPKALLKPVSTWKQIAFSYLGKSTLPADPRYVNTTAQSFEVHCREDVYTVDGEIFPSNGEPLCVTVGPTVRLAVSPTVDLGPTMRIAAEISPLR